MLAKYEYGIITHSETMVKIFSQFLSDFVINTIPY